MSEAETATTATPNAAAADVDTKQAPEGETKPVVSDATVDTTQSPEEEAEAAPAQAEKSEGPAPAKVEKSVESADDEHAKTKLVKREYNEATGKWEEVTEGGGDDDDDDDEPAEGAMNKSKEEMQQTKTASFSSLFRFADGLDIFLVILGALGAIGVGGALPAFSLLFGDLINDINDPNSTRAAAAVEDLSLTFLYVGIGMFGGGFLRVFGLTAAAKRQTHKFRVMYLRQMLRQDVAWHDTVEGKEFTSKLADAATKFEAGLSVKFGEAMTYLSAFVVGVVIGFVEDWKLTLVILALLPLAAILGAMFGRVMASAATAGAKAYASAGGVAEESIASIRTVTSLNGQGTAFAMYSNFLTSAQQQGVKSAINGGALFGVFNLFMYCAYALAFWYGSTLVVSGELEGGTVLTVFFCVLFGAMMVGQAGPAIQSIQDAQAVAYAAYQVIDRVPEVDIEATDGIVLKECTGQVRLEDVRFAYPSRPDAEVLKGVSFEVAPGTSLALVGGSGCGKSTCMALIQRFYEPSAGVVSIDGHDIRSINVASLRRHIGIVSQEPTLFATTIMDNIKYGAGSDRVPTDEEVFAATKSANIHDFIESLPEGYNTNVGDQGIQLSGGQKQRVAIARALLRNPTILLLDEATSALDTQSERIVQEALDNLMADRTTIMIAHRLSTVRKATQIIVMESGTILERGTHNELAEMEGGIYAELARLQALNEKRKGKNDGDEPDAIESLAKEEDPELLAQAVAADRQTAEKAAQLAAERSRSAAPDAAAEEQLKALEAKKQQAAKMADWNKQLMAMSFTNGCEYFKLVIACLMAAVNGAVLPVFSIVFTEMLTLFFKCTPIPFLPAFGGCGALLAAANEIAVNGSIAYACNADDTAQLLKGDAVLDLANCQAIYERCEFKDDEAACEASLISSAEIFSGWFVLIGVAAAVGIFFQIWLFGDIGAALTRRIREASFKALLRQDIGFFDKEENSTGSLTTKLAEDAAVIEAAVGKNIGVYVQNGCTVIVALIIAFVAGWELTLLMLGLMPFLILGNIIETRTYLTQASKASADESQAGQVVSEAVRGVRTVSSFGIQPNIISLYDRLMRRKYDTAVGTGACAGLAYGYSQFIMFAIYTCSFLFAAWLIKEDRYTAAEVMRVFFVLLLSAFSIGQAVGLNADVARGQKAIPSIFGLLETESKIDPTSKDGVVVSEPVSTGVKGHIEFRDVKFAYPSRKGQVLKGVSFTVEPGQTVALVGGSGSGKSTCFALLERFYDLEPTDGEILLDGKPLREYNIRTLRKIFGQVEQEPRLFGTSIRNNVLYGTRDEYMSMLDNKDTKTLTEVQKQYNDIEQAAQSERDETDTRINSCLQAANASSFVETLPKKLDTPVGEQGKGQLSGGQKQRVAIARALLRDAPVMLLDEATSALDSESEKLVQDALNRIMEERTTLVIAHRLSTIQDADLIIVMDKGVIVERGTHQELLELDQVYAELCREQSMATA